MHVCMYICVCVCACMLIYVCMNDFESVYVRMRGLYVSNLSLSIYIYICIYLDLCLIPFFWTSVFWGKVPDFVLFWVAFAYIRSELDVYLQEGTSRQESDYRLTTKVELDVSSCNRRMLKPQAHNSRNLFTIILYIHVRYSVHSCKSQTNPVEASQVQNQKKPSQTPVISQLPSHARLPLRTRRRQLANKGSLQHIL